MKVALRLYTSVVALVVVQRAMQVNKFVIFHKQN